MNFNRKTFIWILFFMIYLLAAVALFYYLEQVQAFLLRNKNYEKWIMSCYGGGSLLTLWASYHNSSWFFYHPKVYFLTLFFRRRWLRIFYFMLGLFLAFLFFLSWYGLYHDGYCQLISCKGCTPD